MPLRITKFRTPEERKIIEKVSREIDIVKETGKIVYGSEATIEKLQNENIRLVLISKYGKREMIEKLKYMCKISDTSFFMFPGDVRDLGEVCDRPHIISAVSILDPGSSEILKIV